MPSKYVHVQGVATFARHRGPTTLPQDPPDRSRGRTLLCVHDRGRHGGTFEPLLDALASDHSPLAFDFPGHGRSGELDSLGEIARMREHARELARKLGLAEGDASTSAPVLIGHGMGGAVALDWALEAPGELAALVLCSADCRFDLAVSDEQTDALRRVTEGKARREFDRSLYARSASPEIMRAGFMSDVQTDPRAGYGDLLACRAWNRETELLRLSLPILIVSGADAPPEPARRLAAALPHARSETIADAAHMLPLEQPKPLADAIARFLGELS